MITSGGPEAQATLAVNPRGTTALLADAHVHIHAAHDPEALLDSALTNFTRAAANLNLSGTPPGILLLAEVPGMDAFRSLAVAGSLGRWTFQQAGEPESLHASRGDGGSLVILSGCQVACREDLEVLALATREKIPDGMPIEETIAAARRAGAIVVLPWGFGKWWFRRGRILAAVLERTEAGALFLGDSGGRPGFLPEPRLFRAAVRRGVHILPGTDPFPFRGEERRVGSHGFLLRIPSTTAGADSAGASAGTRIPLLWSDEPARILREALLANTPIAYGSRETLPRFVRNQARMQIVKRRSVQAESVLGPHPARPPVPEYTRIGSDPPTATRPGSKQFGSTRSEPRRGSLRALVIAPQPFFTPRGTPFSVYHRTRVTAELGVEIDFLTYGQGLDVDVPGVRILRGPAFRALGAVPVGPSILKLFHDVFLFGRMVSLCLRRRYAFVHTHEEGVFLALFLQPFFRIPLVYDMHSCLPQQLTHFRFTRSRLWIRLFERLENAALRRAHAVITICPELADYAEARMPDRRRHFLIENSLFDPVRLREGGTPREAAPPGTQSSPPGDEAESSPEGRLLEEIPAGTSIVIYAGTFEPYQGIDLLLEAFALVVRRRDDALLLLIGGTPDQVRAYEDLAGARGLAGRCLVRPRMPQDAVRRVVSRCAVQISPRIEGTNTPLKVYEQLASGIPLVATRIRSHTQVVNDEVCFLVDPAPESMAAGILAAMEDRRRREDTVSRARDLYAAKYSREVYVEKMQRLLASLGIDRTSGSAIASLTASGLESAPVGSGSSDARSLVSGAREPGAGVNGRSG